MVNQRTKWQYSIANCKKLHQITRGIQRLTPYRSDQGAPCWARRSQSAERRGGRCGWCWKTGYLPPAEGESLWRCECQHLYCLLCWFSAVIHWIFLGIHSSSYLFLLEYSGIIRFLNNIDYSWDNNIVVGMHNSSFWNQFLLYNLVAGLTGSMELRETALAVRHSVFFLGDWGNLVWTCVCLYKYTNGI